MIFKLLSQPGHVFGQFQTITHGLCVPSTCTHQDVEVAVKYYLADFTINTGLRFDVHVEEHMCQVEETPGRYELGRGEKLTMYGTVLILLLREF